MREVVISNKAGEASKKRKKIRESRNVGETKEKQAFPDRNVGTVQSPSNEFLKPRLSCAPRIRKGKEFQRR